MNHDLYWLFNRYWWLLFPLAWGIGALVRTWLRHARAREALNVLKSYAEQGKEPPPELIAVLRQPDRESRRLNGGNFATYGWIPVFLFGALAGGFVLMGLFPSEIGVPRVPMFFVAIIMAGLCIGNLVAMQAARRQQDRTAPP